MSDIESEYSEAAESESSDDEVITNEKKKITKKVVRNPDDSEGSQIDDEESVAESVGDSYASSDLESQVDEEELYEDALDTKKKATKKRETDMPEYIFDIGEEDSSDEEEDYGPNYLQKLDGEMKQDIILDYHPELIQHNYEEVEALSTIVYDEFGVINDPLHQTLPFLTKYEKARLLGERAKQINGGAKPFVNLGPEIIDGFVIALAELEQKKIPFIIRRPLLNGGCEYWKLKDLEQI